MDFEQRTTIRRILEAGVRGGDPTRPVEIEWERLWIEGNLYMDTWHARLRRPVVSITFGTVRKLEQGGWSVAIFPNGGDEGPNFYVRYCSRDRAVEQFEQWTRFNWRRIQPQPMGHSWGKAKERPSRDTPPQRPGWDASIDELGRWIARNG
jgi:hypothetical protein